MNLSGKSRRGLIRYITCALAAVLFCCSMAARADIPALEDEAPESIRYWKPSVITPNQDKRVAKAQQIFERLLRAWDSTRVAPVLYVVKSGDGPWAASLDDGSILLGYAALTASPVLVAGVGDDRLAFVLAHELAHQRDGHLWHRQFFRLAGAQVPDVRRKMLSGLQYSQAGWSALETKEVQADRDGMILMSVAGFNPYSIVSQENFFSAWVESIWGVSCREAKAGSDERKACDQAESRVVRSRAQLRELAVQTALFELGIQAYVAGQYAEARRDFIAFGKEFSGRVVHANIGLTYLDEALQLNGKINVENEDAEPAFMYPLMLGAAPSWLSGSGASASRGETRGIQPTSLSPLQRAKLKKGRDALLEKAIQSFEQALNIDPGNRQSYIHLACAYLAAGNSPMARGILEGKYRPRFGTDAELDLLLAMADARDGNIEKAKAAFLSLQNRYEGAASKGAIAGRTQYALYNNFSALLKAQGDEKGARALWGRLAQVSKRDSDPTLFRLAVSRLREGGQATEKAASFVADIRGYAPGENIAIAANDPIFRSIDQVWMEGESFKLFRSADGAAVLANADHKVMAAWQQGGTAKFAQDLAIGDSSDRLFRLYGIPDRRIFTDHGEYYAYDRYGMAVHVEAQQVQGWFIYHKRS